ncbi:MAG: DNA primase [Tenericutes bacterium]|nr:DNA primase [Mycoplasmatota bacterium]
MALSQEKIIEIRQKSDIVDIISEYIPLEQKGKNYFALCPFHDDHNPSMSISREKQIYKCFVCGASGNVFNFIMDYENISFLESVKIVANKVNIPIDIIDYKQKSNDKFKELYDIYDMSNKYYQNNLKTKDGIKAIEYLKRRKIDDNIIKEFQIGLSTNSKLYELLKSKNYNDDLLLKSGIVSQSNERIHDTFLNRIMFPLYDLNDKIVGFSGRIYEDSDQAKYINSKDSDIFHKGELIYNYKRAKDEAKKKKSLIITEGFMDVIGLYRFGIKNVIATMGTAVTSNQISIIKKMSNNIILCFDGDNAGEIATISCANEFIKAGVKPNIIRLNDNLDPEEFVDKYGVEKFEEKIKNSKTYLDYKIEYYKMNTNFDNSEAISKYIKDVLSELDNEDDKLIREITIKNLSIDTGLSINTINNSIKKIKPKEKEKQIVKEKVKLDKYHRAERELMFYMIRYEEVLKIFENNRCFFPNQVFRFLSNELVYFYRQYEKLDIADFLTYLNGKEELLEALKEVDDIDVPENYSIEAIHNYIDILNDYGRELEIKRLNALVKNEIDEDKKIEIINEITRLKVGE